MMEKIDIISKIRNLSIEKNGLSAEVISREGLIYNFIINAYRENIWRLQIIRNKEIKKEVFLTPSDIKFIKEEETIILKSGDYELNLIEDPLFFYIKKGDKVVLSLNYHRNVGLILLTPPLGITDGRFCGSFSLTPQEGIFGLGEIFNPCERHSQKIEVWVNDAYGTFTERSYKPFPFLWSTKGYGILFNTFYKTIH
ncbi:MAG: hypothetical protein ACK4SU_06065, partial [Dictyoglomus sp.]